MSTYEYNANTRMQNEFQPAAAATDAASAAAMPLIEPKAGTLLPAVPSDRRTPNSCAMQTVTTADHIQSFLKNHRGRWARIDFLIGNGIEQRVGQIMEVGSSYLVLGAIEPETLVMCDLFSIKFVTIITDDDISRLFTV